MLVFPFFLFYLHIFILLTSMNSQVSFYAENNEPIFNISSPQFYTLLFPYILPRICMHLSFLSVSSLFLSLALSFHIFSQIPSSAFQIILTDLF